MSIDERDMGARHSFCPVTWSVRPLDLVDNRHHTRGVPGGTVMIGDC